MTSHQKRVYPWKYAAFGGIAFAVVLSLVSFCIFLLSDIIFPPKEANISFSFSIINDYLSIVAFMYIIIFFFSLILGLFVFVRLLRTRVTLLFVLIQATILWFLFVLFSLAPLIKRILFSPEIFPWKELFFDDLSFLSSYLYGLITWLIAVMLTFGLLRILRIL